MLATFTVEIGAGLPRLSVPWRDSGNAEASGFIDLRARPDMLASLPEAVDPALYGALAALNSPGSSLFTAKCDLWHESTFDEEEQGFFPTALRTCASYIDVLWVDPVLRSSFAACERKMQQWVADMRQISNETASTEFILRSCEVEGAPGFYWSVYISGFGVDPAETYRYWSEALLQVVDVMLMKVC